MGAIQSGGSLGGSERFFFLAGVLEGEGEAVPMITLSKTSTRPPSKALIKSCCFEAAIFISLEELLMKVYFSTTRLHPCQSVSATSTGQLARQTVSGQLLTPCPLTNPKSHSLLSLKSMLAAALRLVCAKTGPVETAFRQTARVVAALQWPQTEAGRVIASHVDGHFSDPNYGISEIPISYWWLR